MKKLRKIHPNVMTGQRQRARGVVLIISLFVLLAISLMAGVSMQSLGQNERMAGNFKDRQIAFQAAEATLRDAQSAISSNAGAAFTPLYAKNFSSACTGGLCFSPLGTSLTNTFTPTDWTGSKTWALGGQTGASNLQGLSSQPRYTIEYQGTSDSSTLERGKPCVAFFLITAKARGGTANTEVVLQSIYRHRVGECYESV